MLLNLKSLKSYSTVPTNKQCDSDPIPTWLLKKCSALLVPTITNIVNLSLSSGNFHHTLKESVISPLLKKPTFIIIIIIGFSVYLHKNSQGDLTSPLTVNITPLKLLSYTYMITLLTPQAHVKFLVSAFPIYRPPSIPLTTTNLTHSSILLVWPYPTTIQ